MTTQFTALSRTAALSVAITLFATPIASAQTPAPASNSVPPANTALLSNAAFARLMQVPAADLAPAPGVKTPPRLDFLHHSMAALAREAHAVPPKAGTPQGSWGSRHPAAKGWLIIAGVVGGVLAGLMIWGASCDGCFE